MENEEKSHSQLPSPTPYVSADLSERDYPVLFASLPECYLILDRNYTIVAASNAYLDAAQTRAEDVVGYSIFEVLPDNIFAGQAAGTQSLRTSLQHVLLERLTDTRLKHKHIIRKSTVKADEADEHYWCLSSTPIFDTKQEIVYVILRFEDVTGLKQTEKQLKQTQTELERFKQEYQQFINLISHDLQEPLRTATGFCELLKLKYQDKLDERADKFITYIIEGVNRASALIDGLLSYARIYSRGKEFRQVTLDAVLRQAENNLHHVLMESKAKINSLPLPEVLGDEDQLLQLFQYLIDNALKFRKKDLSPRIIITVEQKPDEWHFAVRDNGIGIEPQFYEKIFNIFQRLHTRTEYPGIGMGLTMSKRIVERHGGKIWVESQPGEGSTFYFSLPRVKK